MFAILHGVMPCVCYLSKPSAPQQRSQSTRAEVSASWLSVYHSILAMFFLFTKTIRRAFPRRGGLRSPSSWVQAVNAPSVLKSARTSKCCYQSSSLYINQSILLVGHNTFLFGIKLIRSVLLASTNQESTYRKIRLWPGSMHVLASYHFFSMISFLGCDYLSLYSYICKTIVRDHYELVSRDGGLSERGLPTESEMELADGVAGIVTELDNLFKPCALLTTEFAFTIGK